jgi:hypothetical protein
MSLWAKVLSLALRKLLCYHTVRWYDMDRVAAMQVVSDTIVSASGDGSLRVWGIDDLKCRKVHISAVAMQIQWHP